MTETLRQHLDRMRTTLKAGQQITPQDQLILLNMLETLDRELGELKESLERARLL